jgi:hypothetical protein
MDPTTTTIIITMTTTSKETENQTDKQLSTRAGAEEEKPLSRIPTH